MVTLNHRDRFTISKRLLELGRINDVGKKQGSVIRRDVCAEILRPLLGARSRSVASPSGPGPQNKEVIVLCE